MPTCRGPLRSKGLPPHTPPSRYFGSHAYRDDLSPPTRPVTAQSPDDHVVFSHTIEVLFRKVLAPRITPAIEAKMKAVGVDLSKPLDPAYPLRVFDAAMEVVAVEGMSHLEKHDALRKIGELQVDSFMQTFLGKATFQFLKLLSRERFVTRLTNSWRQANNFIETQISSAPDGSLTLRLNDVGRFPEVIEGVLFAGFKAAGHDVVIETGAREGLGCDYRVRFLQDTRGAS